MEEFSAFLCESVSIVSYALCIRTDESHSLTKSIRYEAHCDKTTNVVCVLIQDSDQPGHLTGMKKAKILTYPVNTAITDQTGWMSWLI